MKKMVIAALAVLGSASSLAAAALELNAWKVVAFDLPDAKFSKRCNGGDLRLQSSGSMMVGGVHVQEEVK